MCATDTRHPSYMDIKSHIVTVLYLHIHVITHINIHGHVKSKHHSVRSKVSRDTDEDYSFTSASKENPFGIMG